MLTSIAILYYVTQLHVVYTSSLVILERIYRNDILFLVPALVIYVLDNYVCVWTQTFCFCQYSLFLYYVCVWTHRHSIFFSIFFISLLCLCVNTNILVFFNILSLLIDWLIDWLIDLLIDWLIDWLIYLYNRQILWRIFIGYSNS